MQQMGSRIDLVVLQPTPFCNISCKYCYLPSRDSREKMSLETMSRIFAVIRESNWLGSKLKILWHAGEPLAVNVDFYNQAFDLIGSILPSDLEIQHAFQTNGTLINDRWCQLFKDDRVTVGVSIDGPPQVHDTMRVSRNGRGTLDKTLKGVSLLKEYKIPFSVLCVLTKQSLGCPDEMFAFFEELGIDQLCFNVEELEGANTASSLSPGSVEEYRAFMTRFFRLALDRGCVSRIREFDRMFDWIFAPTGTQITNSLTTPFSIVSFDCYGNFSTFSPEFLGLKNKDYGDFIIGNAYRHSLEESRLSNAFHSLSKDIALGVDRCRSECDYFAVCGGGAPVNKLFENGSVATTETMYCSLGVKVMADLALDLIQGSPRGHELARAI